MQSTTTNENKTKLFNFVNRFNELTINFVKYKILVLFLFFVWYVLVVHQVRTLITAKNVRIMSVSGEYERCQVMNL